MIVVAKDPKRTDPKRGRPPGPKREYVAFQLRLAAPLHKALLFALSRSRRTKNAECEVAIEKHLEEMGLYTPPSPDPLPDE